MPIPPFTIDKVLPPYVGATAGGPAQDMSPYAVTVLEVASTLGTSDRRKEILRKWLQHRAGLRGVGFIRGFQWLDGSFVEEKEPNDLDVVTFLYRPAAVATPADLRTLMGSNPKLFNRSDAKAEYMLDTFFLDLNGSPEGW